MSNEKYTGRVRLNFLSATALFFVSLAVTALQISLMGALSVTRYHHFSYLVISTALLGFGVSGTFLFTAGNRISRDLSRWFLLFLFLFTISVPFGYYVAQYLPLDIQYVLYSPGQIMLLAAYNLCLFFPFFFAAVVIGLALTSFGGQIPVVYGVNLLGSGMGGLVALGGMQIFDLLRLPAFIGVVGLLALISWGFSSPVYYQESRRITFGLITGAFLLTLGVIFWRFPVPIDQYKALANFQRLERQGDASRLLTTSGPWGRIDAWESDRIHHTLFAGLTAKTPPPPEISILQNGDLAGTVFNTEDIRETGILDATPQSLPYRLLAAGSAPPDSLTVLLLGEIDGTGIWLAKRFGARQITVVQPNPRMIRTLRSALAEVGGHIFTADGVRVVQATPRLFLERHSEHFDIIQLSQMEQMAALGSGMTSLNEDDLLTIEAIRRGSQLLTKRGLLTVTRGLQMPPRDNIRLFGLFVAALEAAGITNPGGHMLQGRNYLAVNTILTREPLSAQRIEHYRRICGDLVLDPDYYPGIRSDTLRQRNQIAGPSGTPYSYLSHAAREVLSPERERFYGQWMYRVTPPTDDRPYFYHFFRWRSLGKFMEVFGKSWFQKLELGSLILTITFLTIMVTAFLLILLPLVQIRSAPGQIGYAWPVIVHFSGIGFAFLFLEMVFIQRFTSFLGHPIYSATAVLTSILVFAGAGSILQGRVPGSTPNRLRIAAGVVAGLAFCLQIGLTPLLQLFIQSPFVVRFVIIVAVLAPVAFFMGWLFPSGLELVERHARELVPWAWGINGFASVAASPLAILLAMAFGFSRVIALAAVLYLLTGLNSFLLGREAARRKK